MRHSPQTTRFAIFNQQRSSFSVYMILRIKFRTRTRISLKNVTNTFRNESYGNDFSCFGIMSTDVEKCIYGDGMNSFQNESHSAIM